MTKLLDIVDLFFSRVGAKRMLMALMMVMIGVCNCVQKFALWRELLEP